MATVDQGGRLADRHTTAALNWNAGTRLNIGEHDGSLVITTDPHGVFQPTKQGYLRLPADARRAADVSCGDGVLLLTRLDRQTVTVFPPVALDDLLLDVLSGGEDA